MKKATWNRSSEIYHFHALNEEIPLTVGNCFEGFLIFGGSGSGKTSGPGTAIPLAMLKEGFGGLVLCAKADETFRFKALAKATGREDDLIIFNPASPWRYNFLDATMQRGGVEAVVEAFDQIGEALGGESTGGDDVWDRAARQLLRNILDLLRISGKPVEVGTIYSLCVDPLMQESLITLAKGGMLSERDQKDLGKVEDYLLKEYAEMGDKTKASVRMNMTGILDPFLRGDVNELFCTSTNLMPEVCREGKILIVDMSIKTHKRMGLVAAIIWKLAVQKMIEEFFGEPGMVGATDKTRPCFIYADECQHFMTAYDPVFQETARSARGCTVYLSQNLATFRSRMGRTGKDKATAILGNLQTKILCQNSCPETYKWATELVGNKLQERHGQSADVHAHGGGGANISIQRDVVLEAEDFQLLARGDREFRKVVTGILIKAGRTFRDSIGGRRLWTQVAFQQLQRG